MIYIIITQLNTNTFRLTIIIKHLFKININIDISYVIKTSGRINR